MAGAVGGGIRANDVAPLANQAHAPADTTCYLRSGFLEGAIMADAALLRAASG